MYPVCILFFWMNSCVDPPNELCLLCSASLIVGCSKGVCIFPELRLLSQRRSSHVGDACSNCISNLPVEPAFQTVVIPKTYVTGTGDVRLRQVSRISCCLIQQFAAGDVSGCSC